MVTITGFVMRDVRFPTSLDDTGSDAMNEGGDYSAAYCILQTDTPLRGHGMSFIIGRGNDLVCAAIPHVAARIVGKTLESLTADMGSTWRHLVSDSSATRAPVDRARKGRDPPRPGIRRERAVGPLGQERRQAPLAARGRHVARGTRPVHRLPVHPRCSAKRTPASPRASSTPSPTAPCRHTPRLPGWLGYAPDKMRALLRESLAQGYTHFKIKVGGDPAADKARLALARDVIGYDAGNVLMLDANQVWSVPEAIERMQELAEFEPWFIEEPTSPDDVLGHAAVREALKPHGIGVATGEMCQNRVMFKQFLQAQAMDVCQVDACRLGGVNEVLAALLMAKKFGVPVVPHSGGVGLPEHTQHLSTIDYVVVSGKRSLLEYVDHLHEHFLHPSVIKDGFYTTPVESGYSVEMKEDSMEVYAFPGGKFWTSDAAKGILNHLDR